MFVAKQINTFSCIRMEQSQTVLPVTTQPNSTITSGQEKVLAATAGAQNILVLNKVMSWLFIAVGVVSIISNLFVICVIIKSKKLRQQPRNWLIFHMSIADFLNGIFIISTLTKDAKVTLQVSYTYFRD